MFVIAALAGVASSLASARELVDELYFHVDFERPVARLGDVEVGLPTLGVRGETEGRFGKGWRFWSHTQGGRPLLIDDEKLLADFPVTNGSFSVWVRSDTNSVGRVSSSAWGFRWGQIAFGMDGNLIYAGDWRTGGKVCAPKGRLAERAGEWRHVAGTWADHTASFWVDGECVATVTNASRGARSGSPVLRIGGTAANHRGTAVTVDDLAIFRTVLTADEIRALARGESVASRLPKRLTATDVEHTLYPRNQTNAALRLRVVAPRAQTVRVEATVADCRIAREFALVQGENKVAVPFDPSRFRVGEYPWTLSLTADDGQRIDRAGKLEILPTTDRDAFLYLSWGGGFPSMEFLRTIGVNATIVGSSNGKAADAAVRNGLFANVRYENAGLWRNWGFGDEAARRIAEKAERDLAPFEGLYGWRSTLVNSEVYYMKFSGAAFSNAAYRAMAKRELSFEPDFSIAAGWPNVFSYAQHGLEPTTGTVERTTAPGRALATYDWVAEGGYPALQVNVATVPTVRRLSGGGEVWTEPVSFPGQTKDADMLASWHYGYSPRTSVLRGVLSAYAMMRPTGRGYMPTIGMYDIDVSVVDPTRKDRKGKPLAITLTPSFEEYSVKSWVAISAVPATALSVFNAGAWESGAKTNRTSSVAEPDAPARAGEFARTQLLPAAELLRDVGNVRAPIAFLNPSATFALSGMGWWGLHYPDAVEKGLVRSCLPYDVLGDADINAATLSGYRYVVWPLAKVARPGQAEAVIAAARKGTTVVIDKYCAFDIPGAVKIAAEKCPGRPTGLVKTAEQPTLDWVTNRTEEIRALLPACSTCDLGEGFTFEKRLGDVRYVVVVNDRRLPNDGKRLLTGVKTNDWYRPYGAPQRIRTTIRGVASAAAVYGFNDGERGAVGQRADGAVEIEREYGPGEGRVYCVYPEALLPPEVTRTHRAGDPANVDALTVTIRTKSGRLAPGRTVVTVEVTDPDGRRTDESGRCVVNGGRTVIPVRYADADKPGSAASPWKAVVRDLTTGEEAGVTWISERR